MNAHQRRKAKRKNERKTLLEQLGEKAEGLTMTELRELANG